MSVRIQAPAPGTVLSDVMKGEHIPHTELLKPARVKVPRSAGKLKRKSVTIERTEEEVEAMKKLLCGLTTDLPFTNNALQVIAKRYLLRNHDGTIVENPEGMFARVSKALAAVERDFYGKSPDEVSKIENEFKEVMTNFEFTPAGRTLANAGGPTRLVSNCIVLHIDDSMDKIFGTLADAALLQQHGSGLGFPFHLLRPAGTVCKSTFGVSSGPVSFLDVYNSSFAVIQQQNRHGANMAVMRVDHPDILEFIHAKDREGDLRNFNISVGLTDEFMAAVRDKDPKPWMCSFNGGKMLPRRISRGPNFRLESVTPVEMTASEIFEEIIDGSYYMGEPGCVFMDTVNRSNPVPGLGRIESCNPCGEQFLHDGDVCNLGALNLASFIAEDEDGDTVFDFERLKKVVRISVRLLDNVIDVTDFPVKKVNDTFRGNRRIGLGVMGFADVLYQLMVPYDTEEGRAVAEAIMSTINSTAVEASVALGKEKGVFPHHELSVFAKENIPRRNAAVTNVAPTGTISMMFECSGGVEPFFALAYHYKGILGGHINLTYVNQHLKKALEDRGLLTDELVDKIIAAGTLRSIPEIPADIKRVFVTAMDISAEDHIQMQATFQRYVDNAISKTINFPNAATRADIKAGYLLAWQMGCKGCTAYRDGSRQEQVLNVGKTKSEESVSESEVESVTEQDSPSPSPVPVASIAVEGEGDKGNKAMTDCPDCGARLAYEEGCCTCHMCGFSACSR